MYGHLLPDGLQRTREAFDTFLIANTAREERRNG
jgi:hypothetical protein